MQIHTSRFGSLTIEPDDILLFSKGLFAFEQHRHWVLLADTQNDAVAWLQCVSDSELALPMISPRRFIPEYQLRIARDQLTPLEIAALDQAFVLTMIGRNHGEITTNLKAPVIINLDRRIGRQVVASDEQPLQKALTGASVSLRKSA